MSSTCRLGPKGYQQRPSAVAGNALEADGFQLIDLCPARFDRDRTDEVIPATIRPRHDLDWERPEAATKLVAVWADDEHGTDDANAVVLCLWIAITVRQGWLPRVISLLGQKPQLRLSRRSTHASHHSFSFRAKAIRPHYRCPRGASSFQRTRPFPGRQVRIRRSATAHVGG